MIEPQVQSAVDYWQQKLDLGDWQFKVELVPFYEDKPEAQAVINKTDHYKQATVYITARVTEKDLYAYVLHEMLHALLHDYDLAARAPLDAMGVLGDGYEERLNHEEEALVHRLTKLLIGEHDLY